MPTRHHSTPVAYRRPHANTTKKGWRAGHINRPPFEPKENGCPVRTLQGAEFKKRAAELEARDQAERAKAQGVQA
jgi:hypothetical protein